MEVSGTSESGSAGQEDSREEVAIDGVLAYWLGFGGGPMGMESPIGTASEF